MKRMLAVCMVLFLLVGCSRTDPAPVEPETPPDVEKQEVAMPETVQEPEASPEPQVTQEPEAEENDEPEEVTEVELNTEPEVQPEPTPDFATVASETFDAITEQALFRVLVWQQNDSRTDLEIRKGVNDWNVEYVNDALPAFTWTEASIDDWLDMAQEKSIGSQMTFWDIEGEGGMSFTCCEKNNIVCITDPTKITYLRAEDPQGNGNLYDLLSIVAEDTVSREVLYVTADGTLSPQGAAGRMAEKIAENYRFVPDWVVWKPEAVRAERAEVYDLYRGTPEEFCFNLGLAVKLADPMAPEAGYWQAGEGLSDPDGEGFYGWGRQVLVRKNDEGDWAVIDCGTGGYGVNPEWPAEKPWAAWLVELFCLTEGFTHDQLVPVQLLSMTPDQMATLPELLDQLTEAEGRELCSALGTLLRQEDQTWEYTVETLKPLLGNYGTWLDA